MTSRKDLNERLDHEIRFHIEQQTEKNIREGMTPDAARRAALLKFGGVDRTLEYTRDQFRWASVDELMRDLRVAVRMWKRSRGAAAVAIFTLAIGIGANTAMFSLLNALILNPLPYPEADRLVSVWDASERNPHNEVAFANFLDWRAKQRSFESLGLYRWWTSNLTSDGTPERVQGFQATADVVEAFGVRPHLGRWFRAEENEPGQDKVALIGYGLWQRRYGAAPEVLGRRITVNGVTREIIGVMPKELNFPPGADLMAPIALTPEYKENRQFHGFYVVGRLKHGVSIDDANADIATIANQLAAAYPRTNRGLSARVYPLASDMAASYSNGVWLLMATVGFVLLIACANLANLLLARAPARVRELAVRVAIGASRGRIVRQLVIESLVLAVAGGSLGAALAAVGVRALRETAPPDLLVSVPGLANLGVDGPVLAFTLALTLLTGIVFGLLPALRASGGDANSALRDASRPLGASGGNRLRGALVTAEVALALVLLSGAGFTLRAFSNLVSMNVGFDARNVLTIGVTLPYARYNDAAQIRFFTSLLEKTRAIPGITNVGLTSHIPLAPGNASSGIAFEGRPTPAQEPEVDYRVATAGYFEAIRAHVVRGRTFADTDTTASPRVMVVNEAFVHRFFENGSSVLGKRVRFTDETGTDAWREIVGIVADIRHDITRAPQPETYVPITQLATGTMFVVAKTREDALGMASALGAAVRSLDPDQPVWAVRTLESIKDRSMAAFRALATFVGVFGAVALFLSAVGIFGVVSFLVSARTQEIGLRMALGARAEDVVRLIVRQSSVALIAGFVIGTAGAFAIGQVMTKAFPEVTSADPAALAATALLLIIVSVCATWIPARRAAAVHPVEALRAD